ncbi:putative dNA glycosylase [Mycobacteroides abscessus MAB_091912_2446]|uniref:Putative dNA glycosylase n=1 Tax=Mycobacteroides abscessus MAB_091912_2446 TaxID=1335414 RepID=A0A829M555_9MYCO|nr:putative dNA glycosylase [Mycobacteroides abscessus MAB_091912_2446]
MPEGDTVFRTAKLLDDALGGRILTGCDIRVPRFATVDLSGQRVEGVIARGSIFSFAWAEPAFTRI